MKLLGTTTINLKLQPHVSKYNELGFRITVTRQFVMKLAAFKRSCVVSRVKRSKKNFGKVHMLAIGKVFMD